MHLIIGFITALASLLYALEKLGVDIGWLNPWAWKRRRAWAKQYHANPAFSLESPMEVVALLLLATAKIDGELSLEEKNALKAMFETNFTLSAKDAAALFAASAHLLADGVEVCKRPKDVLARSLNQFSLQQKQSTVELLDRIASVGGAPSDIQSEYIASIKGVLFPTQGAGHWQ